MEYINDSVRRQDRLLDVHQAAEVLRNGEHGVLSMYDADADSPYAVPVNYVWDGSECIYIHCAPEGRKLRCIARFPRVTFVVTGDIMLRPSMFTTEYQSVVLNGTACICDDSGERQRAIEMILDKYAPDYKDKGVKAAAKSFHRLQVIKVALTSWSGKSKFIKSLH